MNATRASVKAPKSGMVESVYNGVWSNQHSVKMEAFQWEKKVALVALALLVAAAVFTIINRGISVRQSQSHEAKYSQEKMKDSEASKEGNETELELLVRELSLEEG